MSLDLFAQHSMCQVKSGPNPSDRDVQARALLLLEATQTYEVVAADKPVIKIITSALLLVRLWVLP